MARRSRASAELMDVGWCSGLRLACAASLLLLIGISHQAATATTIALRADDAQAFADAIADWGTNAGDVTLLLPRGQLFAAHNITFRNANGSQPFTRGSLTIKPGPDSSAAAYSETILDAGRRPVHAPSHKPRTGHRKQPRQRRVELRECAGMRRGAFQVNGAIAQLTAAAKLHLQNIVLINMCVDNPVPHRLRTVFFFAYVA